MYSNALRLGLPVSKYGSCGPSIVDAVLTVVPTTQQRGARPNGRATRSPPSIGKAERDADGACQAGAQTGANAGSALLWCRLVRVGARSTQNNDRGYVTGQARLALPSSSRSSEKVSTSKVPGRRCVPPAERVV